MGKTGDDFLGFLLAAGVVAALVSVWAFYADEMFWVLAAGAAWVLLTGGTVGFAVKHAIIAAREHD